MFQLIANQEGVDVYNSFPMVSIKIGTHFCKSKGIKSRDCFANIGEAVSVLSKEILLKF